MTSLSAKTAHKTFSKSMYKYKNTVTYQFIASYKKRITAFFWYNCCDL